MFKYKGFDYNLDQVTQAADDKGLSVDEYVNKFGLETVEDTVEIQADPNEGKTNGVAQTGATVTPKAGQAPESTELESVDISSESQQIDNSQEAILKRRKLNALEEAAIMQQPVELNEVVVTADAPKPFSYWKDLVLSPEYEEAFEQIQKDTGEFSSTKDQGFLGYLGQLGKLFSATKSKDEQSTYEPLNLDLFTRIEIAKDLDPKTLEKAKKGFLNLKEKESIIKKAKGSVINRSLSTLENDFQSALEDYDKQYDPIKSEAKAVQDRINSTFNFDNEKPIIATKASADLYNNLIDKLNTLKSNADSLNKDRKTLVETYEQDIDSLNAEYGVNLAKGFIENNFQLTNDIEEYNKSVGESNLTDLTSRLGGGIFKTGGEVLLNFPALVLSTVGDMFTDPNSYSYFDAFKDTADNLTNYNAMGEVGQAEVLDEDGKYVKDPLAYVKMTADMLPFTLGIIASAKKGDLKGVEKLIGNTIGGKKGRVFGLSDKLKRDITMANAAFKMTVADNIKQGEADGLTSEQALAYGSMASLATGLAQSVMPDINFLKSSAGKNLLQNFRGNLKSAANKQAISKASSAFVSNVAKEYGEEQVEYAFQLANNLGFNLGLPDYNDFIREQKTLLAGTLALSGGLQTVGTVKTFNAAKDQVYKGVIKNQTLLLDQIQYQKSIAESMEDTEMVEQLNNAEYFTRNIIRAAAVSPENVTAKQLDLVVQKQNLLDKRKNLDPSFRGEIDEEIKLIDEQIANSRVQKSRAETEAKIAKSTEALAKRLGVKTDTAKDETEAKNKLKKLKEQGFVVDEKDSQNYGTILFNDKGETVILYNEEANKQDNVITTKAHELLHAVLLKTVADNPGSATQLGVSVIEALNNVNTTLVTPEYEQRLAGYLEQANEGEISKDQALEEGLTLLSEAVINGDIVIKETVVDKIKRGLDKVFGDSKARVVFNEGKDVINFIKDYNKSLIKGKISEQVVATAEQGALGTLTQVDEDVEVTKPTAKASEKISPRGKEFIKLAKEGVFTNESLVETIKSPSSKAEDKFGAIEAIVENNFPVISKAIKFNPTGSIPMDAIKEAITEQIQGIFPGRNTALFDTYNPETSKVTTFIDTRLGPRQAEILERAQAIGGTTQGVDITEARGVAVEETTPARTRGKALAKKPTETVTYSDEVLSNVGAASTEALENRITEEIQTAFKGKNISRFKELKDIPKNITQLYADMFGLSTVNGIVDFKRNFPKLDEGAVRSIRTFLNRNAEDDFRRLPKTKDDKKRATGIKQTKLGKVMYDANDNLVGTLKQYKDILQGKNITLPAYDGEMIEFNRVVDGKKLPIYRDSQHYKAALKFHIQNRIAEDVMPDRAQRLSAGVKFSTRRKVRDTLTPKQAEKLIAVSVAQNINTTLKTLGEESASVKDDTRPAIQRNFLNSIKKHKLRPNVFLGGAFASSGSRYERKADGNVYYKLSNGKEMMGIPRRDADGKIRRNKKGKKLFSQPTAEQVVEQFGEGVTLLPARGKLYYGVKDPAYIEALAAAKENLGGIEDKVAKKVTVKAADTDTGKSQAKVNMEVLEDVVMQLDSAIKAGMPSSLASMVILQGYQATSGLIKIAAPFRYKSKVFKYGTTPKQREGEKFREEHNPPASVIGSSIIFGFSTGTTNIVMPAIKENYYQTKLSKADDQKIDEAKLAAVLPEGYTILDNPAIRLAQAGIDLNSIINYDTGKSLAEELGVSLDVANINATNVAQQNQLVAEVIQGNRTPESAQKYLNEFTKLKSKSKASSRNNSKIPSNVRIEDPSTFDPFGMVDVVARQMFPEQANSDAVKAGKLTSYEALDAEQKLQVMAKVPGSPVEQTIAVMDTIDTAIANARKASAKPKGISVWDFDDTLATTKSNVLYTMPDGAEGVLTAEQFAKQGEDMLQQGAEFDFSEFNVVTKGGKGPMFEKAVARNRKFGNDNVFILTARTQAAAKPIHDFLKAIGLDIPLKNIVGLGNSTPEAKARWVVGKAAEGYNDFYFADDAYKNVKAVQNALEVLDVKSKTQQAFRKASSPEKLDADFNTILEQTTGIASEKEYKRVKAEVAGAARGKVFRGIPYSAQDFVGLLYETLSKGKLGDSQMAWYKEHLIKPFARAMNDIDNARLNTMQDYRALKKQLSVVPKDLRKKVPGEPYTREQAVRVYIWNNQGTEVPGISKQDLKDLTEYVQNDAELQVFADQVIAIQKGEQYATPQEGWPTGSITTDILRSINTDVRSKYLKQWQDNVDVIFSEKNMNKLEAAYGKPYRKAMENMLQRMKTGRNRTFSDDTLSGRFTDWLQGSIGTIMFFNTRSALLQTISSINFINFTDNNPLAAAKAFGNQKQYWSDFMTLINSDFLKARRSGLRFNVTEADIANMAREGGPRAVVNQLLQLGFAPTQVADSFAIASGGATFYRNRIKSLMKQGMSKAEAEAQAFEDFRENSEESQQSSRPDRISMQQAGPIGRLILAFANTPAQYARLTDKAIRDLKNNRGDAKTNISKIIYYTTVQNLIFNALQQALFAMAFDDEEPDDKEKKDKYIGIANGMADSLLRGAGFAGAAVSVGKNSIIRIINEMEKKQPKLEKVGYELTKISPPISAKLSRINQAARSYQWDKDEMVNGGWGLDNPAYLAVGNVVSALTNVPIDRGVKKINNVVKATDSDLELWERLALFGGWQDWEIGIKEETKKSKPQPRKTRQTKRRSKERKTTNR